MAGEALDHEVKFVLPERAAEVAATLLRGCCRIDSEHPVSVVESIYFDTPELSSWHEKSASDYRKTKIRLRWYDSAGPVWLELKRRVGSRREKRRIDLAPGALDATELSQHGLAHPALAHPSRFLLALREPLSFALVPVAHLRYRRRRFLAPGSDARLALDSALECRAIDRRRCASTGHELRAGALPWAVVESKGGGRELPAALAGLAALGARQRSFSKFSAFLADRRTGGH